MSTSDSRGMPALKLTRARKVGLVGVIVVLVIAAHYLPGLTDTVLEQEMRNALHILGFAVVAALVFEILPGNSLKTAAITLVTVGTLGVVAEFAQRLGGKIVDFNDVYRDLLGVVLYLSARLTWPGKNGALPRKLLAVVIGVLVVVPLANTLVTRQRLVAEFPVIADFDSGREFLYMIPISANLQMQQADAESSFTNQLASLTLLRQNWSGVQIEPVVTDWSGYRHIAMTAQILGGAERSQVEVYLNDGMHSGVRSQHLIGGIPVAGVPVEIRLPLRDAREVEGRPPLDTGKIRRLYIIGKGRSDGAALLIDNVRLEK